MPRELAKRVDITTLVRMDTERVRIMEKMTSQIQKEVALSKKTILVVDSMEDSAAASNRRTVLKELRKQMENKRLEFGRIIKEFGKGWDAFFKEPIKPAEDEISRLQELELVYVQKCRELERKAEEERQAEIKRREAIQKAHEEKGHKVDETPRESLIPEVQTAKTMTLTKTLDYWTYEVIDESQVPREYLTVDTVKINQVIKRKDKPVREIPGLKIYKQTTIR